MKYFNAKDPQLQKTTRKLSRELASRFEMVIVDMLALFFGKRSGSHDTWPRYPLVSFPADSIPSNPSHHHPFQRHSLTH